MRKFTFISSAVVGLALMFPAFASANVAACYTPNHGVDVELTGFKAGDKFVRQIKTFDDGVLISDRELGFTGKGDEKVQVTYPVEFKGVVTLSISHRNQPAYDSIVVPFCPSPVVETPVVVTPTPVVTPEQPVEKAKTPKKHKKVVKKVALTCKSFKASHPKAGFRAYLKVGLRFGDCNKPKSKVVTPAVAG